MNAVANTKSLTKFYLGIKKMTTEMHNTFSNACKSNNSLVIISFWNIDRYDNLDTLTEISKEKLVHISTNKADLEELSDSNFEALKDLVCKITTQTKHESMKTVANIPLSLVNFIHQYKENALINLTIDPSLHQKILENLNNFKLRELKNKLTIDGFVASDIYLSNIVVDQIVSKIDNVIDADKAVRALNCVCK